MTADRAAPPSLGPQDDSALKDTAVGPAPLPLVYLGHDLRAALAEMRSGLQLVRALTLPPQALDTLSRCIAAGDNLSRLVDQSVLVCLGRTTPGLRTAEQIVTADWIGDFQLRLTGLAGQSGHSLVVDILGPLPEQFAMDRTALDRVVSNLVLNAFRHTPPCAVRVEIGIANGGDGLALRIADSGPGFPPDVLAALHDGRPLLRENRPADSGFGLQSALYLVRSMGAECRFDNPATGGAEIRLSLPFADDAPAAMDAAPDQEALARLRGASVLLVEDTPTCRAAVQAEIANLGMIVTEAADGMQAIQRLLAGAPFDLMLLDDQLPELTGLEILNWINAHLPPRQRPAVLLVTAHAEPARIRALTEAGALRVLTKPLRDLRQLVPAMIELLDSRRRNRNAPAEQTDLSSLQRLARMAGPEAAAELFDKLREDLACVRAGLAQAAGAKDLPGIRKHSHVLIALAGTAGAGDLHDDAVRLNGLAHSETAIERTTALAARLDGAIDDLLRAVRDMAPQASSAPDQP